MQNTKLAIILILLLSISGTLAETSTPIKWIDARQQGSYYATLNSLIRDDSGRIQMTYCSSGEPFNQNYAPDWRATAVYATDKVRYQYSDNNGTTWSTASILVGAGTDNHFWEFNPNWKIQRNWAQDGYYWEFSTDYNAWIGYQKDSNSNIGTGWGTIMRTQENLFQGPCANVIMYYKGKYYIYFESYTPPSATGSVYVARSNLASGPYEVWTYDGWRTSPTNSTWKPVIKANILTVAGDAYVADHYKQQAQGNPYNLLYGAGFPRSITQKDGKIYLYYLDTTYWLIWKDEQGNIHEYDRTPAEQIPYQLVAIGEDPTNLENTYANRMVDSSGTELWDFFSPKYFPEQNKFYTFFMENINGQNKIVYRTSDNGIIWSDKQVFGNAPLADILAESAVDHSNNTIEAFKFLSPISDKSGYGKLSDLYLTYSKEYILSNAPVGWKDTPNFKWYYGGTDIYGFKINFPEPIRNPVCSQFPNITYSQTQVNNFKTQWEQNQLSLNDFMNKIRIWKYCS